MVVLIPKVKEPSRIKDLRPISLCNVIYKVVSKVIANQLKLVLPEIVSENQSAFIPGRLIADNSIIAFECIHHIQTANANSTLLCAYKLDLSKAYDRVDWLFLERGLSKWGFSDQWISRVMACISSVKYSVKFNGKLLESFSPSRGLRQGDPLSPFLFLFVADALSILLNKSMNKEGIQGVTIYRGARSSHIFYLRMIPSCFSMPQSSRLSWLKVLNMYMTTTGQLTNLSKWSIR